MLKLPGAEPFAAPLPILTCLPVIELEFLAHAFPRSPDPSSSARFNDLGGNQPRSSFFPPNH